jgi:hypothetical protein
VHEVLFAQSQHLAEVFASEFAGMTVAPVALGDYSRLGGIVNVLSAQRGQEEHLVLPPPVEKRLLILQFVYISVFARKTLYSSSPADVGRKVFADGGLHLGQLLGGEALGQLVLALGQGTVALHDNVDERVQLGLPHV